jgi:hypothetical protein
VTKVREVKVKMIERGPRSLAFELLSGDAERRDALPDGFNVLRSKS